MAIELILEPSSLVSSPLVRRSYLQNGQSVAKSHERGLGHVDIPTPLLSSTRHLCAAGAVTCCHSSGLALLRRIAVKGLKTLRWFHHMIKKATCPKGNGKNTMIIQDDDSSVPAAAASGRLRVSYS